MWSGSANGNLALWNLDSSEAAPLQKRKVRMAKLNCIEAFSTDNTLSGQRLAAAGVTSTNEGALHLYDISH